ncbi:hypothetical protein B0H14DRAFT_2900727 [Mycena olivaceomarginata]|nr:hypothetical protein B0H14DRAFT_2900727 [Mycena olivaceomarginata]
MASALHRAASHVGTKYWYVLVHHRHTGRKIPDDRKYSLPFFFLTSKHVARVARAQLGASRHIMHALLFTLLPPRPMVLTRMAARAEKSIIRWLPSEILTTLMLQMSRPDLVSLCRTSRLLCNIATPLLYRTVCLLKAPQIEYFLRTMAERLNSLPPLSHYVRQFTFFDIKDIILDLLLRLYKTVLQFSHLEHLYLFIVGDDHLEFVEMLLKNGFFPNLSTFQFIVQRHTCDLLSLFSTGTPR